MPIYQKDMADISAAARQMQQQDADMKLKKLLLGSTDDKGAYQPGLESRSKGAEQEAINNADINAVNKVKAIAPEGSSVTANKVGYGIDPTVKMGQVSTKGDAAAISAAKTKYLAGIPGIEKATLAAEEGLNAVNDPKNKMSRGQFLGAATRALGLSRFPNREEAAQILPPSLMGEFEKISNFGGSANNTMNDADVAAANSFLTSVVDSQKKAHDMLKQNVSDMYSHSPYAIPQGLQSMAKTGLPLDTHFNKMQQKYGSLPKTPGPALSAQPSNTGIVPRVAGGLGDFVKTLMGGGGASSPAQAAPQAAPAQGMQSPMQQQGGLSPEEQAELAALKAKHSGQ